METRNHEVFDISSGDEDEDLEQRSDFFLESFFQSFEKEDSSDDVVIVGEVASQVQSSSKVSTVRSDGDDDECLVLDGDPDKPVQVENDGDTGNGSDDLLIVGEKGQIACRDYPHPRHLCARYPFITNPHEKYCDLCHCYVCDTLAPCIYWGTGVSKSDHCHSTDKEDIWRVHRKCIKQGLPAPKHPEYTFSPAPPWHKSNPAITLSQSLNSTNTLLHTLPKPNTLRACSSTDNFGVPSIISQRSHLRPGDTQGRNRLPHHGVNRSSLSPGSSSVVTNIVRRDKGSGGGSLGPRFVSPNLSFKRPGYGVSTLTKNISGQVSCGNNHIYNDNMLQQQRKHHTTLTYNASQIRSHELKACQSASQQQQSNCHTAITYNDIQSAWSEVLNSCQSVFQPTMGDNFMDSQSYNISLQPQVYSQPIPQPSENQNTYLHEEPAPCVTNQDQNTYLREEPDPCVTNQNLPDFELNCLDDAVQGLASSAVNSELPTMQSSSEPSLVPEFISQCPEATNLAPTDFDLASWIQSLEHPTGFETGKDIIQPPLDFVASQAAEMTEAAMLFDFENSV